MNVLSAKFIYNPLIVKARSSVNHTSLLLIGKHSGKSPLSSKNQ